MELTNEIWKDVIGYEGLYKISSAGRVFSCPKKWFFGRYKHREQHHDGIIIKPRKCIWGYGIVGLRKDNKYSIKKIHRMVAEAFIENPLNKREVNHINGDKSCNEVWNLEWSTPKENVNHAFKIGLAKRGEGRHNARIVLNTQTGIFYGTIKEAAESTTIKKSYLSLILSGKRRNKTSFILA